MITSTDNRQMKNLVQLNNKSKVRRQQNVFVAEGIKMFLEAPKDRIEAVYVSRSFIDEGNEALLEGFRYEIVADNVFKAVSDTQTPQGIITVVRQQEYAIADMLPKGKPAMVLILESLQDPGNLGTMIRTGEGAGATGIIMNKTTVDIYNPKTIRSTMGSIYRIPHMVVEDLGEAVCALQKAGVTVFAAHLMGEQYHDETDFTGHVGFLVGNEGNGLTEKTAGMADCYIKIPMEGKVESLNAAMAAGILMYEAKRQRRTK